MTKPTPPEQDAAEALELIERHIYDEDEATTSITLGDLDKAFAAVRAALRRAEARGLEEAALIAETVESGSVTSQRTAAEAIRVAILEREALEGER